MPIKSTNPEEKTEKKNDSSLPVKNESNSKGNFPHAVLRNQCQFIPLLKGTKFYLLEKNCYSTRL